MESNNKKTVTRLQMAMEENRQAREAAKNKIISENDMFESLMRRPTRGKAVMEHCRKCSNYDVALRHRCWKKDCDLWLFRDGNLVNVTEDDVEEYRKAHRAAYEKTEKGSKACNRLRNGRLKNVCKKQ